MLDEMYDAMRAEYEDQQNAISVYEDKIEKDLEEAFAIEKLFLASRDTDSHRVCGTCGELKPVSEFYKDGLDKDGKPRYRRDCKDCYKATRIKNARRK